MLRGELFSTEMVKAALEGRKLHTARPCKIEFLPGFNPAWSGYSPVYEYGEFFLEGSNHRDATKRIKPKHRPGDFIYCRETWGTYTKDWEDSDRFLYRADYQDGATGYWHEPEQINWCDLPRWRPSIHMPREAARLFFRVTKVEVMRLEDVTEEFAREDGFQEGWDHEIRSVVSAEWRFREFWLETYGPDARWMWAYWLEPCSREEAMGDAGET